MTVNPVWKRGGKHVYLVTVFSSVPICHTLRPYLGEAGEDIFNVRAPAAVNRASTCESLWLLVLDGLGGNKGT